MKMPGLDLTQVSSNWKKLQAQLKSEKKPAAASTGVKRKRDNSSTSIKPASVSKKLRVDRSRNATARAPSKRSNMGMSESKAAEPTPAAAADRARLLKEHDIAPEDIAAAYGSGPSGGRARDFEDDVNSGFHPSHKVGQYIALDCEMVGTGPPPHDINVLARASLVNYHGEQIYDSYVQAPPRIKVEDYRTFVSGIKPEHMREGYARTEAQVRADVAELTRGKTLVGHALKNDLEVLQLSHPRPDMRDTSRHPKFRIASRGKPPALRKLARTELGIEIQTGEHSSIEDARVAMMLFKKDKSGFEEEHRKHFGQSGRPVGRRSTKGAGAELSASARGRRTKAEDSNAIEGQGIESLEGEDDGFDEDDDEDAVDDDLRANGIEDHATTTNKKKRKTKKKKRTKRN